MFTAIKFWFLAVATGTLPLIIFIALARPIAAASPWYVAAGGNDSNDCQSPGTPCATINGALVKAAPGDTVDVTQGTYTSATGSEVVLITQSVTLLGGWNSGFVSQAGFSIIDGGGLRTGLAVQSGVTATVDAFVIQNGLTGLSNRGHLDLQNCAIKNNSATFGGGVSNYQGTLTANHCSIIDNTAEKGGGISNQLGVVILNDSLVAGNTATVWAGGGISNDSGTVTLNASTVSGNRTTGGAQNGPNGGGIVNSFGVVNLNDSTVSGNQAMFGGGGIFNDTGHMNLNSSTISNNTASMVGGVFNNAGQNGSNAVMSARNSIIAGNFGGACPDVASLMSLGDNLIGSAGCSFTSATGDITGADPLLGALDGYPGYQRLLPGSPAIDAANPSGCVGSSGPLATDERGYPRVGRCDIGAYEVQALDFSDKTADQPTSVPGQPTRYTIRLNNSGSANISSVTVSDTLQAGMNFISGSLSASSGTPRFQNGVITWTGPVNGGASVIIQYEAASLPSAGLGTVYTNTAVINGNGQTFNRSASVRLAPTKLYVPMEFKPRPGIQGYVTVGGIPAGGVFLELRDFDGTRYSTQMNTVTDASGFYDFAAPALAPGHAYYVRYLNTGGTPGRLWFWGTPFINSYAAGATFGLSNFDLADVPLVSPAANASVPIPSAFQWARRPASPTDNYQFALFDPNSGAFGVTGLLGYVNGFNLSGVPSSFHAGRLYYWEVLINSPDGGSGTAYEARGVTFSNTLAVGNQQAPAGGITAAAAKAPPDRPRP